MKLDIEIDKLTPCLENAETGELVQTRYSLVHQNALEKLQFDEWGFNWNDGQLDGAEIFKLTLLEDDEVQGLIAIQGFPQEESIYVNIAESAPHNKGVTKRYIGVGGHLFAIAAKLSIERGYGGFVFMDAKNPKLVNHYKLVLGATFIGGFHPFRMYIDEKAADELLKRYTLEEG